MISWNLVDIQDFNFLFFYSIFSAAKQTRVSTQNAKIWEYEHKIERKQELGFKVWVFSEEKKNQKRTINKYRECAKQRKPLPKIEEGKSWKPYQKNREAWIVHSALCLTAKLRFILFIFK